MVVHSIQSSHIQLTLRLVPYNIQLQVAAAAAMLQGSVIV